MEVLTTVFEMGTGVAPPEEAPEFWNVLLFTQNISFIFFHGCRARPISTARLNALLRLHLRPINLLISQGSQVKTNLGNGFTLRCFQRLSAPNVATRQCPWQDNRSTRGSFISVLSY